MARNSLGLNTPFSVIIAVISSAGVTSNAGFQHDMPESNKNENNFRNRAKSKSCVANKQNVYGQKLLSLIYEYVPGAAILYFPTCVISLSGRSSICMCSPLATPKSIDVKGAAT